MLCQQCQTEAATIHITQMVDNQMREYHLCAQCALKNHQVTSMLQDKVLGSNSLDFITNNFLTGFLGGNHAMEQQSSKSQARASQCSKCGMTYEHFTKSGMLGCVNCYSTFASALQPVIKKIHGSRYHSGKTPAKSAGKIKAQRELESLRMELNKAIYTEQYERAAEIRDKIRSIEKNQEGRQ